ncbi:hypothetical protein [Kutzneria sp. CA-103260]|uniref:hypothetical protein n=1 Tax=Kutzneria sp. CA-103260 TaxID=2802641 RepID=UPI001BAA8588|nr:hypothetical protein [Kutzneria sp. CA-103260]QUQ68239.1 hypothetical protein JJ691_59830 [Kutzneria sp. CA-103260]
MTQLRQAEVVLPVAESGQDSPGSALGAIGAVPWPRRTARPRDPRPVPAVVLENDLLIATVLIGCCGRLHSLWHKREHRPVPFCSPAFQPASGGPVFAAPVDGDTLRVWEWDTARDLPFQIDFALADGQALRVDTKVRDPRGHTDWDQVSPGDLIAVGSGWGALELTRLGVMLPATPFTGLGAPQRPWLELLRGNMIATDPEQPPGRSLVSAPWRAMLESAPENWLSAYHLGVARWHARESAAAIAAWRRSIELAVSPWALRNLAVAEFRGGHVREAAELLTAAAWSTPAVPALSVEAVDLLLAAGQADEAATLLRRVPT